ncbi:Hypothetical protein D9617_7g030580 [Elsinoe fawcettii]|nr:Hypothetical protein D9617_7g030580 [Elsinoe fawcettii]
METAGLSLICNILQLMKVSKSVIETCREIYHGSAAGSDLVVGTTELETSIKDLEANSGAQFKSNHAQEDAALLQQCGALREQAKLLQQEASNKRLHRSEVAPDASENQLDDLLQTFRALIREQERRHAEDDAKRQHRVREDLRAQVLRSLRFPRMFYRRDMIEKAHEATFRWVFELVYEQPWDPFPKWLSDIEDKRPYWISGKPGAGKSTLVNFIDKYRDLKSLLKFSMPDVIVHVISHYLWLAGPTTKEKSIEGILRSLLFQVISKVSDMPNLADLLRDSEDWTIRLLKEELLLSLGIPEHGWLIILDGLDESTDKMRDVVDVISLLTKLPNVKILASSRPLQPFETFFGPSKKMRVQDLTKEDVREYFTDRLGKALPIDGYIFGREYSRLIENGVSRAQGVFLWVKVAANAVLEAIEYREPLKDIHTLLEQLPSDLNDMFAVMLSRLHPRSKRQALVYFQLMLSSLRGYGDLNLIEAATVDLTCPSLRGPSPTLLTTQQVLDHAEIIRPFAQGRCGSFIEIVTGREGLTEELTFIHRSAHDFLRGYFNSPTSASEKIDATQVLVDAQIHLLRLADDHEKILGAIGGHNTIRVVHYMSCLPLDTKCDLLTLWDDVNKSCEYLMRLWSERLDMRLPYNFWPYYIEKFAFAYFHFEHSWKTIQDSDLMNMALRSRSIDQHNPSSILCDKEGIAARFVLTEVVERYLATAKPADATYLAHCCIGGQAIDLPSRPDAMERSREPRGLVGLVGKLFDAGADIRCPLGQVKHVPTDCVTFDQRGDLSDGFDSVNLWCAFLDAIDTFKHHEGIPGFELPEGSWQIEDILDMLKMFVAKGADIRSTYTDLYKISRKNKSRQGSLRFISNLSATMCSRAARIKAWAPIASYVWELDAVVDIQLQHHSCRLAAGNNYLGQLRLEKMDHLMVGPLHAFANLREQPWCPYQPDPGQALRVAEMLEQVLDSLHLQVQSIRTRITARDIRWDGRQVQGPSLSPSFVTCFEHEGLEWEWESHRDIDPETLQNIGIVQPDGLYDLSEEDFPPAPWSRDMMKYSESDDDGE